MQGEKAMNDNKQKDTEFDELDAAVAAALADDSAWPVPSAGFEERCVARIEELVGKSVTKRTLWPPRRWALLKIAAVFVAMLAFSSVVFNAVVELDPQKTEPCDATICALSASTDMGSKCEYTARLLEKEVSRKAAMTFLANACTTDGI